MGFRVQGLRVFTSCYGPHYSSLLPTFVARILDLDLCYMQGRNQKPAANGRGLGIGRVRQELRARLLCDGLAEGGPNLTCHFLNQGPHFKGSKGLRVRVQGTHSQTLLHGLEKSSCNIRAVLSIASSQLRSNPDPPVDIDRGAVHIASCRTAAG